MYADTSESVSGLLRSSLGFNKQGICFRVLVQNLNILRENEISNKCKNQET